MEFDPLQSGEFFTFSTKSENKILLRTDNKFYKADYLLERISSTCCDKQVHFFQDVPAIIDLPIISPNGIYESRKHLSLEFPVHIGEPKKEFRKELGKEHQIILKYKSSNVGMSMIDALEKNFKIKIPENKRPETKRLIYADKNTPVALIEEITNYYRLKNITKVYLVLRTDGICNKIETHLKNIHDFDPSNSKTIDEWLHKESKS